MLIMSVHAAPVSATGVPAFLLRRRVAATRPWYLPSLQTTHQGCGVQGPSPHR